MLISQVQSTICFFFFSIFHAGNKSEPACQCDFVELCLSSEFHTVMKLIYHLSLENSRNTERRWPFLVTQELIIKLPRACLRSTPGASSMERCDLAKHDLVWLILYVAACTTLWTHIVFQDYVGLINSIYAVYAFAKSVDLPRKKKRTCSQNCHQQILPKPFGTQALPHPVWLRR